MIHAQPLVLSLALSTLSVAFVSPPSLAAQVPSLGEALRRELDAAIASPELAAAHVGVFIVALDEEGSAPRILIAEQADRLFLPASNQKILTGAAALLALGPDHRFDTSVHRHGLLEEGVLAGNLVVVGSGDPSLGSENEGGEVSRLHGLARQLHALGLRRVTGDLIGVDDAFEDGALSFGSTMENVPYAYNAEIGALQLDQNAGAVIVTPPPTTDGEVGIVNEFACRFCTVEARIEVVAEGTSRLVVERRPGSSHLVVRGWVVAGGEPVRFFVSLPDPTRRFLLAFRDLLAQEGIAVDGAPRDCDDLPPSRHPPELLPVLARTASPPLRELLPVMMKESHNLYAETLVLALGRSERGEGSFEAGREAVRTLLAGLGLAPDAYAYTDGSGLSRYNWVSPRQLVEVLAGMRREPRLWPAFRDSLPVAGVDGTLAERMLDTAAQGRVLAKTGTISNVSTLSGYVLNPGGEEYAFAILVNGLLGGSAPARALQDRLCELLAGAERGPG